jgi:lipopolysaccharide/colanic/teichoic acid biosynthesis glycosyltransferase
MTLAAHGLLAPGRQQPAAVALPLALDPPRYDGRQVVKAVIEWLAAVVLAVVLAPVLLVLVAAVRLDSRGAPVFRQTRVGRGGRLFTVYKLRTMVSDAEALLADLAESNEASDGLLFKIRQDPRVTRVGAALRRWSLDELPQLWNVVRGDMALIGPRPPLPSEVARYDADVARRLLVRPGITGLWQVSGRSTLSWDDTVRLDLYYVENWSLTLDSVIIWRTLAAVLGGTGAY